MIPVKPLLYSLWSAYSVTSILSVASMFASLSVLSVLSLASFFSIGSMASVLSIGSVASVLSVGSVNSMVSISSTGCTLGVNMDCTIERSPGLYPIQTSFDIHISESVWTTMKDCSQAEYKSASRPDKCDYQDAECTFTNTSSGFTITAACEIRRKGSGSWRDLEDKPSFKIRRWETIEFGRFSCGDVCPPHEEENVWRTNRVTLNNQVQADGEITAYNVFRTLVAAPLAVQTMVRLYRAGVLYREDSYVMLETIDDSDFMEKWFGDTYVLYEQDCPGWCDESIEFERYGGDAISLQYGVNLTYHISECANSIDQECYEDAVEDATEAILDTSSNFAAISALGLYDFDRQNIVRYFAGEYATQHVDGACWNNNVYIAYNGTSYFYIPSGADRTFQPQCGIRDFSTPQKGWDGRPACSAITECLEENECRSQYDIAEDRAMAAVEIYAPWFECENWHRWRLVVQFATLVPLSIFILLPIWNRFLEPSQADSCL